MPETLDFEQPLLELETRIAELQALDDPAQREEIGKLEERLQRLRQKVFSSLTAWQTTQLARHPRRPHTRDFCKLLFEDFLELHGDRLFGDDPAIVPGIAAEERGQAEAIARNLREMAALRVPVVAVVTGEGGSGGALAIGVGNRVLMLRYAVYSVISPEGCAAILWGDAAKAAEAAEIMKITATDLQKLGVIDEVVAEPAGGAHRDWDVTALNLKAVLADHLRSLRGKTEDALVNERHERFRRIGA